jgi:ABC-type sulfate/molybdate transport systems ATPase subunit
MCAKRGQVEQVGSPPEVYDQPASPFVCQFVGQVNVFSGRVQKGWALIGDVKPAPPAHRRAMISDTVTYVRPHDMEVRRKPGGLGVYSVVDVENTQSPVPCSDWTCVLKTTTDRNTWSCRAAIPGRPFEWW